jgi:hypothetical protein
MKERPVEQPSTPVEVQPVANAKGLSYKGLVEIFYQPAAFFERLINNPKILVPYLVLFLIVAGFFYGAADLIMKMQVESPRFQAQMQGQEMTPKVMAAMKYSTMIFGTLSMMLIPLLAAALALFWCNFVFAGKAGFKQLLSMMLYGEVLYMAGGLLMLPMMLAKGTIMVSLSLAVLAVSSGPESILYVALSKINLFLIWEIIIIGIGLSILYKVPRNKGYLMSVLSMGMLSILHVIATAIGSMMF